MASVWLKARLNLGLGLGPKYRVRIRDGVSTVQFRMRNTI